MLAWQDLEAAGRKRSAAAALEEAERSSTPSDPINLQYTSGTTGLPKGALLSHRNLLLNAFYAAERPAAHGRDRICIPVPFYHCFGCVLGTMCAVGAAARRWSFRTKVSTPRPRSRPSRAERCTAIYGVPTMFIAELEHPTLPPARYCRRCGPASWRAAPARSN